MSSAKRSAIDTQAPGSDTPGAGPTPSTGKNSKPVEGATPSPEAVAAAGGSKADATAESVKAEKADQPAEAELGSESPDAPPVAAPEPGDVADSGVAAGGDGSALPDIQSEVTQPDASDGRADPAPPADAPAAESELDELSKALRERDQYLSLAQRTQADFENFRKRTARDAKVAEARGVVRLVKELLPALDNLGRALSGAAEDDPLLAGVRLVHQDLAAALRRHGVESYSPDGERFDPAEHEAMAQQPVEGVESGTVVEVYQAGYRLDGTIIRPARVVVAA